MGVSKSPPPTGSLTLEHLLVNIFTWKLNIHEGIKFLLDNHHYADYAMAAYVIFLIAGITIMKQMDAFNLKLVTQIWNVLLAVFSAAGAYVLIPHLLSVLFDKGLFTSICGSMTEEHFPPGPVASMGLAFVISKLPELIDTVLLVLKKRPVILLHWWHHLSVVGFTWYAAAFKHPVCLWQGAMNYGVHSIMYFYYFAMTTSMRKMIKPIGPLVTGIQITQMVWGTIANSLSAYWHYTVPDDCPGDDGVMAMSLTIYASYFVLFCKFFYDSYFVQKKPKKA